MVLGGAFAGEFSTDGDKWCSVRSEIKRQEIEVEEITEFEPNESFHSKFCLAPSSMWRDEIEAKHYQIHVDLLFKSSK